MATEAMTSHPTKAPWCSATASTPQQQRRRTGASVDLITEVVANDPSPRVATHSLSGSAGLPFIERVLHRTFAIPSAPALTLFTDSGDTVVRATTIGARVSRGPAARAAVHPVSLALGPLLAIAAAAAWIVANDDRSADFGAALARVPWAVVGAVVLLPLLVLVHYVSAALALRSVSDERLALRQTTFAQLAAAACNRVVPNGFGGMGVNARYLLRAGLTPGATTSALATLGLVGAATDAICMGSVTALGPAVGLTGANTELHAMAAAGLRAGRRHAWMLLVVVVALTVVGAVRRRWRAADVATGARHATAHLVGLASRPRRVTTALVASTCTTVAMSVGFVVAVNAWGHAPAPLPAGALLAVYLVAAAAGGATPLPAFFGVTEAMLVGALTLAGYSTPSALVAVLTFRGVAFWLPLPLGIAAARRLRAAELL